MILLDTHVLIWLAYADTRLGKRAARRIDAALHGDGVGFSAISFLEITTLCERGRLKLRSPIEDLRAALVTQTMTEVPVDGAIAITAGKLRSLHADPADRLIGATAIEHGATLFTADERMLAWRGGPKLVDASL